MRVRSLVTTVVTSTIIGVVIAGLGCVDTSAPKGAASISVISFPSPSVVVGDVLRDSLGAPAPVIVTVYDGAGNPIPNPTVAYVALDTSIAIDANGTLHGIVIDSIGGRIVAGVGSLQGPIAQIFVTVKPDNVSGGGTVAVLTFPQTTPLSSPADSIVSSLPLIVTVTNSLTARGSQGIIVKYDVIRAAPRRSSRRSRRRSSPMTSTTHRPAIQPTCTGWLPEQSRCCTTGSAIPAFSAAPQRIRSPFGRQYSTPGSTFRGARCYSRFQSPGSHELRRLISFSPFTCRPMFATGGPRNSKPGTLNQLFFDACARHHKPDALQVKVSGVYTPISHAELLLRVRRCALGLDELGVRPGEKVALLAENRPEWAIADYACLTSALSDVPIYPTLPPDQVAYILRDSGAVAIFCSTAVQSAKIAAIRGECPALKHVIGFSDSPQPGEDMTMAELEKRGAAVDSPARAEAYAKRAASVRPDDIATLIYTSGTTGDPKGVMLSHDNLYSNVMASAAVIPFQGVDCCLSFLPLSHVFERMSGHYLMLHVGASIAYAESIDTVPANLMEVRPTLVLSVPRLFEKMYARVIESAHAGGGLTRAIFNWSRGVANRWADDKLHGLEPNGLLALQYAIAQKLVFSKLKTRTGGRLRYFVSGGAPLAPEINKFFYAAGLVILEGYGLTETSPVIAVNTPEHYRIGTVGRPVPGAEVMIASDGEILARGPNVMPGYFNKPAATAEAIDSDGWFHTGDIGELEDDFVRITDRKKDLIVTAGGKKIAPQPLEGRVKTNPFVSQAVMIGDKRKFPVILIVPNWANPGKVGGHHGDRHDRPRTRCSSSPAVHAKMEQEVLGQLEGACSL